MGPDQYRTMMAEAEAARDAAKVAEDRARKAELRAQVALEQAETAKAEAQGAVRLAAEAGAAVITGGLVRDDAGNWRTMKGGPSKEALRPVWSIIRPALDVVADWWQRVRGRVDALPDPKAEALALAQVAFDPFTSPAAEKPGEEASGPGM